ncbi:putative membrane protein [Bradyrhizobium yuanmingense]|uniref:hypothetical protein n=1 Tax=Bradyrhizobium yuanmingense TaxID=108015 RepID=UPI003515A816
MTRILATSMALLTLFAFIEPAAARGGGHGGRVSYGGGKHTSSHNGSYVGGSGSSHRGGSYVNSATGNRYGTHQ